MMTSIEVINWLITRYSKLLTCTRRHGFSFDDKESQVSGSRTPVWSDTFDTMKNQKLRVCVTELLYPMWSQPYFWKKLVLLYNEIFNNVVAPFIINVIFILKHEGSVKLANLSMVLILKLSTYFLIEITWKNILNSWF